ncbi:MAG: NAD-dependent epimerase/dehydratase family protein, partial [Candidatus Wallbacteria bacterium]|nr:NAD-dependent epimerase/dehydratase family protein [Candidatus Wallbacteria bacterium]
MKILITGGAGFIGSHIQNAYLATGHAVAVIDNLVHGKPENLRAEAQFHRLDIRSEEAERVIRAFRPEVVNHLAAQMEVRRSVEDPFFDADVNIIGALRVLKAAVESGCRKFVFSSTGGAIYGEQSAFPATEEHPCFPLSPYGVTKLAFEKYLHYFHALTGMQYVALRYANVYGPGQDPHGEAGVVAIFAERLLAGQQPVINGDGKQTRDYVFVGDVVAANLLALGDVPSGAYNIGTGIETDVNELFRILRELTGASAEETHVPAKAGEQRRSCLSAAKAAGVLGWSPRTLLREGLARTVEYFR